MDLANKHLIRSMGQVLGVWIGILFLGGAVQGQGWTEYDLIPDGLPRHTVTAADLDGDDDDDLVSASFSGDSLRWYENLHGEFISAGEVITVTADGVVDVIAGDLDGDGDLDLLSAASLSDTVFWYENLGVLSGGLTFGSPQVIATAVDGVISLFAADLDGDGDLDVVSASELDHTIAWYENLGGLFVTDFGPQQVITATALGARDVHGEDLDGDGDVDLLSASLGDDTISWYENSGSGSFTAHVLSTTSADPFCVQTPDLDGDGDPDILSASYGDDSIVWQENLGGGVFGLPQIITSSADGACAVRAADLDWDGDLDVMGASVGSDTIAWFENTGGAISSHPQIIATSMREPGCLVVFDPDKDGDHDVVSASLADDAIAWWKNELFPVEDCNGNGVSDLLDIASGKSGDADLNGIPDECQMSWIELHGGVAGSAGLPLLEGVGLMAPGGTLSIDLFGAKPGAFTMLVVGDVALDVPFKGGGLVPQPDVILQALVVPPSGNLSLSGLWPAKVPLGFILYFQQWILDDTGPDGFSATNGISGQLQSL